MVFSDSRKILYAQGAVFSWSLSIQGFMRTNLLHEIFKMRKMFLNVAVYPRIVYEIRAGDAARFSPDSRTGKRSLKWPGRGV
jgi:hypothetical protein